MNPRGALTAPLIRRVLGGTFFIGQLAKSACAYRSLTLTATTKSVTDLHEFGFGACHPNQLVATRRVRAAGNSPGQWTGSWAESGP